MAVYPPVRMHALDDAICAYQHAQQKSARKQRQNREHAFWAREQTLLAEKKILAKALLYWRDEFAAEPIRFPKLFDDRYTSVPVFQGTWGHTPPKQDIGCRADIILTDEGRLVYRAGYKFFPNHVQIELDTPAAVARAFTHSYLRSLAEHVAFGYVYHVIAADLHERAKLLR